ncbi:MULTISPECIES: hypothetical protein [Rhizobium]|uniref:hypothetical protein n=1 Tax=Rhizobium TaxID=379 RepID=UPI002180B0E3|nr:MULTISPECIES: hypothetical protein [Rhizobium]
MLHSRCRLNIGHWSSPAASIVRGLKSPKVDKYHVVRAGDCFLPLDQQAMIVNYIDDMCAALATDPDAIENAVLSDVCMLVMSYQYAFRPGQIARIELADVRLFSAGAVHIAVSLIKQKDNIKRIRVTRRIKREWGALFNELVRARAISPIYSNLAKIAKTRTIDKAMLLGLPADQQIGAVPHGILIAGIGGCGLGQSLCFKNPVLSCYTCSKFMPLGEPDIHQEVLESLRPVVTEFAAASRYNQQSPAYGQLKTTLDAVRRVVEELKADRMAEDQT